MSSFVKRPNDLELTLLGDVCEIEPPVCNMNFMQRSVLEKYNVQVGASVVAVVVDDVSGGDIVAFVVVDNGVNVVGFVSLLVL